MGHAAARALRSLPFLLAMVQSGHPGQGQGERKEGVQPGVPALLASAQPGHLGQRGAWDGVTGEVSLGFSAAATISSAAAARPSASVPAAKHSGVRAKPHGMLIGLPEAGQTPLLPIRLRSALVGLVGAVGPELISPLGIGGALRVSDLSQGLEVLFGQHQGQGKRNREGGLLKLRL